VKAYYDARAREYDEWYEGLGRFDGLDRPRWDDDVRELERVVASLPPLRTLDVACGTGFLTRHLRGEIVGLDQSASMLAIAQEAEHDPELLREAPHARPVKRLDEVLAAKRAIVKYGFEDHPVLGKETTEPRELATRRAAG